MPSAISIHLVRGLRSGAVWTSAIRAMIPPSPSLSARMMKATNSIETISVIDQKTREMTP